MKQSTLLALIVAILTNMLAMLGLMLVLPAGTMAPLYVVTCCIAAGFAGFAYLDNLPE